MPSRREQHGGFSASCSTLTPTRGEEKKEAIDDEKKRNDKSEDKDSCFFLVAMLTRVVSVVSMLLLVHAGFSTIHLKGLVATKLPPIDVIVEVIIAFLLAAATSLVGMADLKRIKMTAQLPPELEDRAFHSPDFLVFNHRGASLAQRRRALKS